eukprot:11250526-Alexandrium_andersonii.AAC.1
MPRKGGGGHVARVMALYMQGQHEEAVIDACARFGHGVYSWAEVEEFRRSHPFARRPAGAE